MQEKTSNEWNYHDCDFEFFNEIIYNIIIILLYNLASNLP